ncbi:MAG: UDP-N-acetylmuramate dehydrogenase [Nitrospirota bacterium]
MKLDEKTWEEIFRDIFKGEVNFMESMRNHTSLKIGGPADVFVMPEDISSLKNLLIALKKEGIPFLPLGGGTNVLIKDEGTEGVVINLNSFKKIEILNDDEKYVNLYVEAGTSAQRLVSFSREKGYSGIEWLAGIPGTVGGAIAGNAGAFGYEIKDVIISVWIINSDGVLTKLITKEIDFGYRRSGISQKELIIAAEITLKKDNEEDVSMRINDFLRKRKERQPIGQLSAGCVFKNPPDLSAGKLIDDAGCKGMRVGDVEVSNVHANFFINRGKANASDFLRLMERVINRVKEISGIILEPEIRIIGR